jgi:hypothetical protein
MFCSARMAARRLTFPPTSLTARSARRVLACGLAGEPQMSSNAWLYDEEVITALRARPAISVAECARRFPNGLFISRRPVDARWPPDRRRAALATGWPIGLGTQAILTVRLALDGSLPMIATVAGFVVDGFDIVGAASDGRGRHDLTLGEPGAWFEQFRDARVPTGRGREWTIAGWETGRKLRVDNPLPSMGDWPP